MDRERGYLIVFTGPGKGKTTAALGMALRAAGHGLRVAVLQFIKGSRSYGELQAAQRLAPYLEIVPLGRGFVHVDPRHPDPIHVRAAQEAWRESRRRMEGGGYFMVVLDEINYAIAYGLLSVEEVIEGLRRRPPGLHVVLTGRDAHPRILEMADLVTEMREVKHPFHQGAPPLRGIEF